MVLAMTLWVTRTRDWSANLSLATTIGMVLEIDLDWPDHEDAATRTGAGSGVVSDLSPPSCKTLDRGYSDGVDTSARFSPET